VAERPPGHRRDGRHRQEQQSRWIERAGLQDADERDPCALIRVPERKGPLREPLRLVRVGRQEVSEHVTDPKRVRGARRAHPIRPDPGEARRQHGDRRSVWEEAGWRATFAAGSGLCGRLGHVTAQPVRRVSSDSAPPTMGRRGGRATRDGHLGVISQDVVPGR
jgi:hypothetical protein